MGDKKGDQQSRAELLGKMLDAIGEKPFLLRHGTARDTYCLILLKYDAALDADLAKATGAKPQPVKVGAGTFLACPLEAKAEVGGVDAKYYEVAAERWTAGITAMPFK